MLLSTIMSYIAVSALVASTPGPSNFLALKNGARYGIKVSALAITGHMFAVFILAILSAFGVGAMIVASEQLFTTVKLFGVAYLLWIGFSMIKSSGSPVAIEEIESAKEQNPDNGSDFLKDSFSKSHIAKLWLEQFMVAISNPKALLFFTSLFPQFINVEQDLAGQFSILLAISLCSSFMFPFLYSTMAAKASQNALVKKSKKGLKRLSGVTFLGFGIAMALR